MDLQCLFYGQHDIALEIALCQLDAEDAKSPQAFYCQVETSLKLGQDGTRLNGGVLDNSFSGEGA